jgi:hypothetical protein
MFGTVCAVAKFRAVTTHEKGQEDLLIRNWKWEAIQVPFQDGKACMRMLSLDWSEQVQEVNHYLVRVATLVHGAKAKPHTKVATINMPVVLGMAFKSGGSVWPLGAIDKLDRQITRITRVALGLTESFPYQLIRAKVGGFGIKSFSQIHRKNTERIITRCMAGPEPGQAAARGLANRAFRTKSNRDRGGEDNARPQATRHVYTEPTGSRQQDTQGDVPEERGGRGPLLRAKKEEGKDAKPEGLHSAK